MKSSALSIIIPSWRGRALLQSYLPAIHAEALALKCPVEIIVVDDASDREAGEAIVSGLSPAPTFLRAQSHRGFAATANLGAAASSASMLLFWNNDMRAQPGALGILIETLDAHPEAFAVVPRIGLADGRSESATRLIWSGGRLHAHSETTNLETTAVQPIAWACGGAMLCRRERFEELGGFAEAYAPFYWEDVDLGLRSWAQGWPCLEAPRAKVDHEHRATVSAHYSELDIERRMRRNQLLATLHHCVGAQGLAAWCSLAVAYLRRPQERALIGDALQGFRELQRSQKLRPTRSSLASRRSLSKAIAGAGVEGWPTPQTTRPD